MTRRGAVTAATTEEADRADDAARGEGDARGSTEARKGARSGARGGGGGGDVGGRSIGGGGGHVGGHVGGHGVHGGQGGGHGVHGGGHGVHGGGHGVHGGGTGGNGGGGDGGYPAGGDANNPCEGFCQAKTDADSCDATIACEWGDADSTCVPHPMSYAMGFDACPKTFGELQTFVKTTNNIQHINLCEVECSIIDDQSTCEANAGCEFDKGNPEGGDEEGPHCRPKFNLPEVNTGCEDALARVDGGDGGDGGGGGNGTGTGTGGIMAASWWHHGGDGGYPAGGNGNGTGTGGIMAASWRHHGGDGGYPAGGDANNPCVEVCQEGTDADSCTSMIACEWNEELPNGALCVPHPESYAMGFDACPRTFGDLQTFVKETNKQVNLCAVECSIIDDQSTCEANAGCEFDEGNPDDDDGESPHCHPKSNLPEVNTGCEDALAHVDGGDGGDGTTGGDHPVGGDGTTGGGYPVGGDGTTGGDHPVGGDGATGGGHPVGGDGTTGVPTLGRALYAASNSHASLIGPSVALTGFLALAFVAYRRHRHASPEAARLRRGARDAYGAV